jgi:hypothetical protein
LGYEVERIGVGKKERICYLIYKEINSPNKAPVTIIIDTNIAASRPLTPFEMIN